MKADLSIRKIKNSFLVVAVSTIIFSCGSFQSASYFESDGIYVSKAQTQQERPQETAELNKNNYYSQYFKDVADGNMPLASDDTYFTDSETYTSADQYQQSAIDNNISQIPWGGETTQTEIIVVNNNPNYLWGLSGFAFNNSPFWNNYYGNQFRFGYGNFYNPYFDFYGGYAGYWGGFNSFYSPFAYYGGFYNPFGFRNPWNRFNRWNRFGYANSFGNSYNNFNNRDYNSTVARIKSGRGEKNYGNSRRNSKTKGDRQSKNNDADVQRTLNRINVGRGVNSLGRTLLIGNSRSTILGTKTAGNSVTARPKINGGTTGVSRSGNVNPTKTANSSSGRFSQSRYTNATRNRTNTTSLRKRSTKTRSVTRSNNRNQYNNNKTSRSYNNTKSNSYRSFNSSRSSNYSSPARSYNSGSSSRSSAGSSSSRGSSSGRRN